MNCHKTNIASLLQGSKHFVVPCYQRPYSWTQEQCRTLFDDLLRLSKSRQQDPKTTHFLGSVVLQEHKARQCLVIDGQQRLITTYLLYLALAHAKQEPVGRKLPFTLADEEQLNLDQLFAAPTGASSESLLTQNHQFFCEQLKQVSDLAVLEQAIQGLELVVIKLEEGDDPQLIFESLNSKGQDLTEGDKVRNFVLMGFNSSEAVASYYQDLWLPIERNCLEGHTKDSLSNFIKDYLMIKFGRKVKEHELYFEFKEYVHRTAEDSQRSLDEVNLEIMRELGDYSKLFARINACSYALFKDRDTDLSAYQRDRLQKDIELYLRGLNHLDHSSDGHMAHTFFTMECMRMHQLGLIRCEELRHILKLLETFMLRRWVCANPSQGLVTWFVRMFNALKRRQEGDDLLSKLERIVCLKEPGLDYLQNEMPTDDKFVACLHDKALYLRDHGKFKRSLFHLLERLENGLSDEQAKIDDSYSIEHVMPQTLTDVWREELGPDAEAIHQDWLHRLGNLTLTAYNSKYSNRPFAVKCHMEHGFASSPVRMNQAIAQCEHWGLSELEQRTKSLIERALKIWPYPAAAQDMSRPVNSFDYCLAEGELDLTGKKLNGYEFKGKHYEAKTWVQLQRDLFLMVYQQNPERMRNWLVVKWGKFDWLGCYLKSSPDFGVVKSSAVYELDTGVFLNTNQAVIYKIKLISQLFAMMEIAPKDLILHLSKTAEPTTASTDAESDLETVV